MRHELDASRFSQITILYGISITIMIDSKIIFSCKTIRLSFLNSLFRKFYSYTEYLQFLHFIISSSLALIFSPFDLNFYRNVAGMGYIPIFENHNLRSAIFNIHE